MKDYVERTWIGTPLATSGLAIGRGKKPIFPVELSNQYLATIVGRPRHNNHMESNNNKLQKLIKANLSVWDFFIGLRAAYRGDFHIDYNVSSFLLDILDSDIHSF